MVKLVKTKNTNINFSHFIDKSLIDEMACRVDQGKLHPNPKSYIKKIIKPDIYSMSSQEFKQTQGMSCHAVKLLKRSAFHYWNEYLNPNFVPEPEKEAYPIGNALHTLVLEPHLFEQKFFIMPKLSQKKDDKEKKIAILEELKLNGKIAISEKDAEIAYEMAESLKREIGCLSKLQSDQIEQSLFWKNAETGIFCKTRPDILRFEKTMTADIKTACDARWKKYRYDAKKFGYHIQAAMTQDGLKSLGHHGITKFFNIVVEKKKPYVCVPYPFSEKNLKEGNEEFIDALKTYQVSINENKWPGYPMRLI